MIHIEFLVEEPSAEAFLQGLLPKVLPEDVTWNCISFQGKSDLLKQLPSRLKGLSRWIPDNYRVVVLTDEDRSDCRALKALLESAAAAANLPTKSRPRPAGSFVVLNRIAVEELEAWFFGDPLALRGAFPRVPATLAKKAPFRNPDAIAGGTWEALERVLQKAGYFGAGMPKIAVAREIAAQMEAHRNTSLSFRHFLQGVSTLSAR